MKTGAYKQSMGLGYWAARLGTTKTYCLPHLFPVLHKKTKQSCRVLMQFFPLSLQNFRKHFSSELNGLFRLNSLLLRKTWSWETGLDSWTGWIPRLKQNLSPQNFVKLFILMISMWFFFFFKVNIYTISILLDS